MMGDIFSCNLSTRTWVSLYTARKKQLTYALNGCIIMLG